MQSGKLEYVKREGGKTEIFPFNVKVCPTDTTYRVVFGNTEPMNIKKWKEETLNTYDLKALHVFFIKNPRDYFETFTWNQNIWPMDLTPANPRPVSNRFATEGNPYFI